MSTNNDYQQIGIFFEDLLEKTRADDSDILVLEDVDNTKKIKFRNFRQSLIDDNEAPANYRLYSSTKIQSMIDEISKSVTDGIGGVQEDIGNLQKDKVSKSDLKTELDKMDKKKFNVSDIGPILSEIENSRKKSELITGADLAYGDDADKIHIKHLGSDILDAMTGKTQVSIPSVPVGGWVGEDLANASIGALKLKKDYSYRGTYPNGDLGRLVETGYYVVGADSIGLPHYGNDNDESRLLEVIRYGQDSQYIIQRVYYKEYTDENRPYFERKGLFSKLSVLEFTTHWDVNDANKVGSALLGDHYNNRGIVNGVNLFSITVDGNYLCDKTVENLPTGEKYLVSISTYDDRKEYRATKADIDGCVQYVCYEYNDSNHALHRTDWFMTSDISKSKFDGQTIHIFGDGIAYGMGASDVAKKAFPAILHTKYGWKINNHALTDATVGNYSDDLYKQRSLLTQIDNAVGLTSDTNPYVLIFMGGEDYRGGMAPIGDNKSDTDTTFKGALILAIHKILTKVPSAKILICTPIYRASSEPGDGYDCDTNRINDKYLQEFADAMVEISKINHIPCLNLFNDSMINRYNASIYLNELGVYPTDIGHAMLAEQIHDGFCRYY